MPYIFCDEARNDEKWLARAAITGWEQVFLRLFDLGLINQLWEALKGVLQYVCLYIEENKFYNEIIFLKENWVYESKCGVASKDA